MQLLTFGGFTLDYLELADGRTFFGIPGGNAVYSAIGSHLWHVRTGLMGRVGRDYPKSWLERMSEVGIETAPVEYISRPHIQVFPACYDSMGHRNIAIPSDARRECDKTTLDLLSRYLQPEKNVEAIRPFMMHPTDIPSTFFEVAAFHCAPIPLTYQIPLASAFKQAGALVSVDPHIVDMQSRDIQNNLPDLLQYVDFFLPSQEEVLAFKPDSDLVVEARSFAAMGPSVVAVKLGPGGSLVYDRKGDRLHHVPPCSVNAIDPTGAGDAYCGGFLAGFLETSDPLRAALWGTVSASFVIEAAGAFHALELSFTEAHERLERLEGDMFR